MILKRVLIFLLIAAPQPLLILFLLPPMLDTDKVLEQQIINIDTTIITKSRELNIPTIIFNKKPTSEPIMILKDKNDVFDILNNAKAIYISYDDKLNSVDIIYNIVKDEGIYEYVETYKKEIIGKIINATYNEIVIGSNDEKDIKDSIWFMAYISLLVSVPTAMLIASNYKNN